MLDNFVAELQALESCNNLVSPFGQYHYRGRDFPDSVIPGAWHASEDGDATFHTSVLAVALCLRSLFHEDEAERGRTLILLRRILFYFQHARHNGMVGRNLVSVDAYDQFPDHWRSGDAPWRLVDSAGGHMRYTRKIIEGYAMLLRYDVSADAVLMAVAALSMMHRTFKIFENHNESALAKLILIQILDYYKKNGWRIRDDRTGNTLRYGMHLPFPFAFNSAMIHVLLHKEVLNQHGLLDKLLVFVAGFTRTYVPGIYKTKETRKQFNNFQLMVGYLVGALFYHGNIRENLIRGIRNLVRECSGERNYFAQSVLHFFEPSAVKEEHRIWMDEDAGMLQMWHKRGPEVHTPIATSLGLRPGYCWWEADPYRIPTGIDTPVSIPLNGHAYLLAYWMAMATT